MPASVLTNWGKTLLGSATFCNLNPNDLSPATVYYIILIDNTFPGFSGNNTDPDIQNISGITGRIDPSNYSGNSRNRAKAAGGFTFSLDDTGDRGLVQFFDNPVITAINTLSNVRGYAIVDANSISTGKVVAIQRFDSTYSLSPSQQGTISGSQMIISG